MIKIWISDVSDDDTINDDGICDSDKYCWGNESHLYNTQNE